MILRVLMLAALVVLSPLSGSAQVEELFKKLGLGKKAALSDEKITSGLKEALRAADPFGRGHSGHRLFPGQNQRQACGCFHAGGAKGDE